MDAAEGTLADKLATKMVNDVRAPLLLHAVMSDAHARVCTIRAQLDKKLQTRVDGFGSSWVVPFVLLVAVVGGIAGFAVKAYRTLVKSHLL